MISQILESGLGCNAEEDRDKLDERRVQLQQRLRVVELMKTSMDLTVTWQKQRECHRDVLLKEASWMSTDFHAERIRHCRLRKRVCKAVQQYFNLHKTRRERREREMEATAKKVASRVSRLIKMFWFKIHKVLHYKARIEFQAAQRKAMDRQLVMLIRQTERYSRELVSQPYQGSATSCRQKRKRNALRKTAAVFPADENTITHSGNVAKPFLLDPKLSLRPYQQVGLSWLAFMHERRLNGILADEMGLGKTVQAIALLAHLACTRGIWGPHLVIAPTSVLVNWESELKRFCPGFKVMTYYGSAKQRKAMRAGWTKPGFFHICVTSYQLAVQDATVFRRKKFYYLILDEAHNIKNFESRRWCILLAFQTQRRLLLTGTPLQNSLMELWSLLHFLMPHLFSSREDFAYWFSDPLSQAVEGRSKLSDDLVRRLHAVLRPFFLRRLKKDVAKQLPPKVEHKVLCKLSRRQQLLYEDFMSRSSTRLALEKNKSRSASDDTNFVAVMNVVMQLRKVCNHPDLFEPRPVMSPFLLPELELHLPTGIDLIKDESFFSRLCFPALNYRHNRILSRRQQQEISALKKQGRIFVDDVSTVDDKVKLLRIKMRERSQEQWVSRESNYRYTILQSGVDLRTTFFLQQMLRHSPFAIAVRAALDKSTECRNRAQLYSSSICWELVQSSCIDQRLATMRWISDKIGFAIPRVVAPEPRISSSNVFTSQNVREGDRKAYVLRSLDLALSISFPDRALVQWDSGKFHTLAPLLIALKSGGHRCLIFTQMSRMLDVLEAFLCFNGHTYSRLDGAIDPDERQRRVDRFNSDISIFCMVLSTRAGGLGINLTGADAVIFYDSDWNPAMDAQATDRAHRIGQTREVHIYRLVCEATVEENIIIKAKQKKRLAYLAITEGRFDASALAHLVEESEDVESTRRLAEEVRNEAKEFDEDVQLQCFENPDQNRNQEIAVTQDEEQSNLEAEFASWQQRVGPDPKQLAQALLPVERSCLDSSIGSNQITSEVPRPTAEVGVDAELIEEAKRMDELCACCEGEILISKLYFDSYLGISRHRQDYVKKRRVAYFEAARRVSEGAAWECRVDEHSGEPFWFNVDTLETSWWTPVVIERRITEADARRCGYSHLAHDILLRIVAFTRPGRCRARLACTAQSFARTSRDDKFAIRVLPLERVHEKDGEMIAMNALRPDSSLESDTKSYDDRRAIAANNATPVYRTRSYNLRRSGTLRACVYEPKVKNYSSLKQAIQNVAPGSTLLLHPGHYCEDTDLLIDKPLRIVGDILEPNRVVLELRGSIVWQVDSGAIIGVSLKRPRRENTAYPLLVVEDKAHFSASRLLIDNHGASGTAVYSKSSSVVYLDRCCVAHSQASALAISGKAMVKRSRLIDNAGSAILLYPGASLLAQDSHFHRNDRGPVVAMQGTTLIALIHCDVDVQLSCSSILDSSSDILIASECRGLEDRKVSIHELTSPLQP